MEQGTLIYRTIGLALKTIGLLAPVGTTLIWLWFDHTVAFAFERICIPIDPATVGGGQRFVGWGLAMLQTGVLSLTTWSLSRLFDEYAAQRYFSKRALSAFKQFSFFGCLYVFSFHILYICLGVLLSGKLTFYFDTDDLKIIVLSLLLVAISTAFAQAREFKTENDAFL